MAIPWRPSASRARRPFFNNNNIIIQELSPTFACIRNGKKRILIHSQNAEYPHGDPNTLEVPLNTLAGDLNTLARHLNTPAGFIDYPAHFVPSRAVIFKCPAFHGPKHPSMVCRGAKSFYEAHDAAGIAAILAASSVNGADLLSFREPGDLVADLRLTPFAARKALQVRDEYLGGG